MKDHVGPMERPRLALANRVIQSGKKRIKKQLIILPLKVLTPKAIFQFLLPFLEKSLTEKSKIIVLIHECVNWEVSKEKNKNQSKKKVVIFLL